MARDWRKGIPHPEHVKAHEAAGGRWLARDPESGLAPNEPQIIRLADRVPDPIAGRVELEPPREVCVQNGYSFWQSLSGTFWGARSEWTPVDAEILPVPWPTGADHPADGLLTAQLLEGLGYKVGIEGRRRTSERWFEVFQDGELIAQIDCHARLDWLREDLPHFIAGATDAGAERGAVGDYRISGPDGQQMTALLWALLKAIDGKT